ncbi:MAG: cell envelope integrity protein TolA [Thermodesulfobacteriota bacterium]
MRGLAWLGSCFIHAMLLSFVFFGGWHPEGSVNIKLRPDAYKVDLVNLPKKGSDAGKSDKGSKKKDAKAKIAEKTEKAPKPKKAKSVPAPKPKKKTPAKKISPEKTESKKNAPEKKKKAEKEDRQAALDDALRSAREISARTDRKRDKRIVDQALAGVEARVADEQGGSSSGTGGASPLAVYVSLVGQRVKDNWRFPGVGQGKGLAAQVRIHLDESGKIIKHEIVNSSGDKNFDASTLKAVQETDKLPVPPDREIRTVIINFNMQDIE